MAENKFSTTGNVSDKDKTPISSYFIIGASGYPVVYAKAVKKSSKGDITFTRGFYTVYNDNVDVEKLMSLSFWEIVDDINNFDNPDKDYILENFTYIPPGFLDIPDPTPTPEEKEKEREDLTLKAEKDFQEAENLKANADLIEKALPDDAKATGLSKLPYLLLKIGNQLLIIVLPYLRNLISQYSDDACPSETELRGLIRVRNNLVSQLNLIGDNINKLGQSVTGISTFLTTILGLIRTTDVVSIATSLALKLPVTAPLPVPGSITSLLNDAQTFIRKSTFDALGNSKLNKIQGVLNGSALAISLIGVYILEALNYLSLIDAFIEKCTKENPNVSNQNLIPISNNVNSLADAQRQANQTFNEILYKGFILEIEEVPYNDKILRRKAIGKNSQGITLIQTELSFTTNPQILINELKFIIDRDNLKAY